MFLDFLSSMYLLVKNFFCQFCTQNLFLRSAFFNRLHNLRFEKGGVVFYTNQYVPSIRHQIEEDLGEDLFHGLGEYKGFIGLAKLSVGAPLVKPFFEGRDDDEHDLISSHPNTACLMYRKKFYCLNEANIPLECRILPDGRLERSGMNHLAECWIILFRHTLVSMKMEVGGIFFSDKFCLSNCALFRYLS